MEPPTTRQRLQQLIKVWPVVFGLLAAVIFIQNRSLLARNTQLTKALNSAMRKQVLVGDSVPWIVGTDSTGARFQVDLRAQNQPRLVISMSLNCQFCLATLDRWRQLAEVASQHAVPAVVVVKDFLPKVLAFITESGPLPGRVVTDPSYGTYLSLRMDTVPTTLLVDRDGRVSHAWIGAFDDTVTSEIKETLVSISRAR